MRQSLILTLLVFISLDVFALREHMMNFPAHNTNDNSQRLMELETLTLPSYFSEQDQLTYDNPRLSPAAGEVNRDDAKRAREYVLESQNFELMLSKNDLKAFKERQRKMNETLEKKYQQLSSEVLSQIENSANKEDQEKKNRFDRRATIQLTDLVADYMEYNKRKRVAFRSNCLEELKVPAATADLYRVDINYMLYDFDRYDRLSSLRYSGAPLNKGPVIILPGRAEPSYKWVEFAHELYRRGYGPIMSIDHRGQGLSTRVPWLVEVNNGEYVGPTGADFIDNEQSIHKVGHVDLFHCYVDDVHTFMTKIAQPLLDAWHDKYKEAKYENGELKYPGLKKYSINDITFIGHSTGGAIAQGYLMRSQMDQKFKEVNAAPTPKNVFLISPMFGLSLFNAAQGAIGQSIAKQGTQPDQKPQRWKDLWKSITSSYNSIKSVGQCKLLEICGGIASDKGINPNLVHDPFNITTHSASRYLHYRIMVNLWPEARIEGISANWLKEAEVFFKLLHKDPYSYPDTKLRIYIGGNGSPLEGERVVDNDAIKKYCNKKRSVFKNKTCEVVPFANLPDWGLGGSRHAIHSEDDWYFEQMMRDIDVKMGGNFLLHDMIVRCEEEKKVEMYKEMYKKGSKVTLTDVNEKKNLQVLLAAQCVKPELIAPYTMNHTAPGFRLHKKTIDDENSKRLIDDLKSRKDSKEVSLELDKHKILNFNIN